MIRKTAVLAAAAVLALSGCAAVRYKPVSHDSRKPDTGAPGCLEKPLVRGGECLALVRADQWWSDTGVEIRAGGVYRITVPRGQVWFDKDRVNQAPVGEPGSRLMNFFAAQKRQTGSDWFSLIAAVVDPGARTEREELQWVDVGKQAGPDCKSVVFTAMKTGTLTLYPNDAKGPPTHPTLYYENNSGQIWVQVRWVDLGPVPLTAPEPDRRDCNTLGS